MDLDLFASDLRTVEGAGGCLILDSLAVGFSGCNLIIFLHFSSLG